MLPGKTVDEDGVEHSACEYCGGWQCQGEHGLDVCISNDATLKSLTVTCEGQILSLSPGFDGKTVFAYSAGSNRTTHVGETVTVDAAANHPKAKVSGTGSVTLVEGGNTVTITVTAEYPQTIQIYTVVIVGARWENNTPQRDPDMPSPDDGQ